MKKISCLFLIVSLFVLTGCGSNESASDKANNTLGSDIDSKGMQILHCTRSASASEGIEVELSYDLYYEGDNLNILHSVEKVVSKSNESLDLYQDAYEKIQANYRGLEYYDAKVLREDESVTSDILINYEKIDVEKLLSIEGEEDNIIEQGKAKVSKWKALAEKFGTKCNEVSNS